MNARRAACIGLCLCVWLSGCAAKTVAWRHPDHSDSSRFREDESYCKRLAANSVRDKRDAYEKERQERECDECSLSADTLMASSFDMEETINFKSCMRDLGYRPAEGQAVKGREADAAGRSGVSDRRKCEEDCRSLYDEGQLKEGITVEACIASVCGVK